MKLDAWFMYKRAILLRFKILVLLPASDYTIATNGKIRRALILESKYPLSPNIETHSSLSATLNSIHTLEGYQTNQTIARNTSLPIDTEVLAS